MALASVLSTQLTMEPENQVLVGLCERIWDCIEWAASSEPMFQLVACTLRSIVQPPTSESRLGSPFLAAPDNLSPAQKLWLSRMVLHTTWRSKRVDKPIEYLDLFGIESFCEAFTAGDRILATLKANIFLTMALSLGLQIDVRDLHVPNNEYVVPSFSHAVHSSSNSDGLRVATNLFYQKPQTSITEGTADAKVPEQGISTSGHLDPPGTQYIERGFLWLASILDSEYQDIERCRMASRVVQHIGKSERRVPSSGIPLLLRFLSLCDKTSFEDRLAALCILSSSPPSSYSDAMILHLLTSILLPTHFLQLRTLALNIFNQFAAGWFSSQMESIPYKDLNNLLQAVGDPFQFPDLPLQDGKPVVTQKYQPMDAVVVLIEFASSDLWRNHLRRSNFTSCEETLSTEEGRRDGLSSILDTAVCSRQGFLCTSAKIITAIRRLEKLQCLNTAEVVILWAWTVGVVNAMDHDAWGSIEHKTLDFYRTHGTRRLTLLSRHTIDRDMEGTHVMFLVMHYQGRPCRVGSVQHLVPYETARERWDTKNREDLHIARACQLKRLCHLFGYNSTAWKEVVGVEERQEGTDPSSGRSVTPVEVMDWACDYP